MKLLSYLICIIFAFSCSSLKKVSETKLLDEYTFLLTDISDDASYGHSEKNPVEVGGGPVNERRFLNALAGPNGEEVSYRRAGSCCPIKSKNGLMGMAMLDNYLVTYEGSTDTVSIYINMYDYGELKAPMGFTIKGKREFKT